MQFKTHTKGYSLVEVLVAVAILMIAIVGPLTIAAKSIQSTQYARQQVTAFFLAQEGISAVQAIRGNATLASIDDGPAGLLPWDWVGTSIQDCFDPDGCNIDFRDDLLLDNVTPCDPLADCVIKIEPVGGPRTPLYGQSGDATPYTRIIRLDSIPPGEVRITSTVQWTSTLFGGTESVVLETSVFNVYE